ncbi:hypothetical protein F2P56_027355 [Juglans regia]|uniref:Uncharacterized protein LOC108994740 n=2 Tax=Juglans regia TaxID=51240 RepID=A0A2I4F1U6_JUGRE|nr:uncharacterized protein LOC108994740 [Juglans regia]KAF5452348.1 hypothetical protein F2P56_027355 [Juglans regia]
MAGIRATSSYEKYLGLPVLISRSRIQAFKGILDRVRARVSNWKNRLLSQAGKEILLKAIIQALPTYSKQAWRIIQKPLSLASQVLKVKYFPTTEFMKAKDKWLPIPTSYKVQSVPQILPGDAKVASIINHTVKDWKKVLVREIFGEAEADTIFKIPISSTGAEDKLIWVGTKDGGFTMKSAYHLQKELNTLRYGQPFSAITNKIEWTNCWKFQFPNAVKTFLWRACLESLPTRFNLVKKQICESSKCPICMNEAEIVNESRSSWFAEKLYQT